MTNAVTILDHLQFDCPTQEQKQALLKMSEFVKVSNLDDFFILCGAAGTGKTSIVTAVIGYLNAIKVGYQIAAPTGRAARILGRKSKTINSTIHSLIYNVKSDIKSGSVLCELKSNEESEYQIYIIDEASMIASKVQNNPNNLFKAKNSLLSDLITYVKSGNSNNKIVFIGDHNQLPPVHESQSLALHEPFIKQHFNLKGASSFLTEVKRQVDGSYILKQASMIREGIEENRSFVDVSSIGKTSISMAVRDYVYAYENEGPDYIISIGATHKMNSMFNANVRQSIYGNNVKPIEIQDLLLITQTWKRNGSELFSGDHVIVKEFKEVETVAGLRFLPVKLQSKNLAGEEELIEDYLLLDSIVNPSGIHVKQENMLRSERFRKNKVYRESQKPWDDRYVGAIRATYGHSITCNKAQGGEWDKVLINSYYMPSLRYQYTAVTRAKQDVRFY